MTKTTAQQIIKEYQKAKKEIEAKYGKDTVETMRIQDAVETLAIKKFVTQVAGLPTGQAYDTYYTWWLNLRKTNQEQYEQFNQIYTDSVCREKAFWDLEDND